MIILVATISISTLAQNDRMGGSPLIIDEFTAVPCGEFMARLDNFFLEIHRRPNLIGVVFISIDPAEKHKSVIAERTINNYVNFRRFPADRIKIVRTNSDDPFYFRFWILPPDADLPDFGTVDNTLILPQSLTEPFLLSTEDEFSDCPYGDPRDLFADFLNANLTARGKIVVREKSRKNSLAVGKTIVNLLTETYGISSDRIMVKTELASDRSLSSVEYWYLP